MNPVWSRPVAKRRKDSRISAADVVAISNFTRA